MSDLIVYIAYKIRTKNKLQGKELLAPCPDKQKAQQPGSRETSVPYTGQRLQSKGQRDSLPLWSAKGFSLAPHYPPQGPADLPRGLGLSNRSGLERKGPQLILLHTPACARAGWSMCLGLRCKGVHGARGTRKRIPTTGVTGEAVRVIQAPHCLARLPCSVNAQPTLDANAYGKRDRREQ